MKISRLTSLAMATSLAFAAPQMAVAQSEWPLEPAEYVEVSAIEVDDGYSLKYANHLAGAWRKSQEFALSQGWIEGYEILFNAHPRKGEPDLYLLTRFKEFASVEEGERRDAAFRAHMAMTESQMQSASAGRADYRRVASNMLLRRVVWKD